MENYKLHEIKRFLKDKYQKILIFSSLFAALITVLIFMVDGNKKETETTIVDEVSNTTEYFPNDSVPAYFRFYMEQADGTVFINYATIQEFLNTESMYEEIHDSLGYDLEIFKERVIEGGRENYLPIKIKRNEKSHIYTAIIELGNDEVNLEVAEFYHKYINNTEFSFLNNKTLYEVSQPDLVDIVVEENSVPAVNKQKEFRTEDLIPLVKKYSLLFTVAFVGGVLIHLVFLILKELLSQKLNYSFGYLFDYTDRFLLYDEELNNKDLFGHFIGIPYTDRKIMLTEAKLSEDLFDLMFNQILPEVTLTDKEDNNLKIEIKDSLSSTELNKEYSEIIIVIQSKVTSRAWLEKQLRMSETYDKPVKMIQINE